MQLPNFKCQPLSPLLYWKTCSRTSVWSMGYVKVSFIRTKNICLRNGSEKKVQFKIMLSLRHLQNIWWDITDRKFNVYIWKIKQNKEPRTKIETLMTYKTNHLLWRICSIREDHGWRLEKQGNLKERNFR